ncbi:hypothetical protein BG004_002220 [Podila humilis]|nr:hypothetical protein BG004_002220 [Podila humilis]
MVFPSLRPMTIAAAAGLVAGSTFTSYTTVYADEHNDEEEHWGFDHDHRASLYPHLVDKVPSTPASSSSSSGGTYTSENSRNSPYHRDYRRTHFINQQPMTSQEEDLMPGLVYVALAGLTGSLVARQRGVLAKMFAPAVFASAAGAYFMPNRTQNLLGMSNSGQSYEKSWSTASSTPTEPIKPSELTSKAREAWHQAEVKADKIEAKVDAATQDAKQWWNKSSSKVEKGINDQVHEAKTWVDAKSKEADKALSDMTSSTTEAFQSVKDWIEKPSRVDLAYDSEPRHNMKTDTKKHWWSSRSKGTSGSSAAGLGGFFGMSNTADHWSNGEEQGTAKVRNNGDGGWFGRTRSHDGVLDNKDVDQWSSTEEEIGTARVDESEPSGMHPHRGGSFSDGHEYARRPHDTEYWTNGEEISSASIRDANYYNYPGAPGASLGRASWWDRRSTSHESDIDSSLASLKNRAESIARDAKEAADEAAHDIASRLAHEQELLSKQSSDARSRAEAALQKIKSQGDALLNERHRVVEKGIKDLEARLDRERAVADKAAMDAKNKVRAWEHEHQAKANMTIKEISDRVAREKSAAERTAAELKAKAEKTAAELKTKSDAWAREQREKAEEAAKVVHDRVLRDAAAAEKSAAAAKAALDLKFREERLRLERIAKDFDERIRLQKLKEEKAAADLRASVDSYARLQKEKMEHAAKELEERLSYANSQILANETAIKAEAEALERRRLEEGELRMQAEKAATADREKKLAAERATKELDLRITREREEAAASARGDMAERAAKERADRAAYERAEVAAREATARAAAAALEMKRHADAAAKEMDHVRDIEQAEATALDAKARAEALLLEKKRAGERASKDTEERLRAERAEAAAREAKAHADTLEVERKLGAQRAAFQFEDKRALEQAATIARDARARAEALVNERKMAADILAKERNEMSSLEKAEAAALDTKTRSETLLAEMRDSTQSTGSGWSWPWSAASSKSTSANASTKHTHDQDGFDSSGHILEHIAEDIRQTKEDFEDGLGHLKDTVLGAENKAADVPGKVRENVREAVNATTQERDSWRPSGSTFTTESMGKGVPDLGRNVKAAAVKAEKDVEERARSVGKDMTETARKAHDNVIDAATTAAGHTAHVHHSHEHRHASGDGHTLMDHIVDDLRQTKNDIQSGVDSLRNSVLGAEKKFNDTSKDLSAQAEEAKQEGRRWWSAKTHEVEKGANRKETELRESLGHAGSKIRELGGTLDEALGREADDDNYWFQSEQNQQQQQRRGSRGM